MEDADVAPAVVPAELTPRRQSLMIRPLLVLDASRARFDLKEWLLEQTGRAEVANAGK